MCHPQCAWLTVHAEYLRVPGERMLNSIHKERDTVSFESYKEHNNRDTSQRGLGYE